MSVLIKATVAGVSRQLSTIGIGDSDGYWDALIISAPSLTLAYPDSGGYIKPAWGSVDFAPDLFADVPDDTIPALIYWLDVAAGTKTLLYSGALVLETIERDMVRYSIREKDWEQLFLAVGADENGSAVSKPILIGTGSYFPAQRTADVGGKQTFYKSGGYKATGLKVLDDYSEVTANMTDNHPADPYGTFSLSVAPVATVYITSSAQAISTLAGLVDFVASKLGVTASYPASYSSKSIVKYIDSQADAVDVLDRACGFFGQVFYFSPDLTTLTCVDRATADPSPIALDSFDFFQAPVEGKRLIRNISTRSEFARKKVADPAAPTAYKLTSDSWYTKAVSGPYGDEIDIDTWLDHNGQTAFVAANLTILDALKALWTKAWASVSLPIDGNIYAIGRDLVISDDTFAVPLTTTMKILGIEYDFDQETVTYRGPGVTV